MTAAPYAGELLRQSLMYLGVAPESDAAEQAMVQVPDFSNMTVAEAERAAAEIGLDCVENGVGERITGQLPAAGAQMLSGSIVMLYVDNLTQEDNNNGIVQVPDVSGLSVVEANRLLRSYGLQMRIEGSGLAVSQSPEAGEDVTPDSIVEVTFEPP